MKFDKIELPESSSIVVQTRQRISEEQHARNEIKESTMQVVNNNLLQSFDEEETEQTHPVNID